jgi:hypothetical protein
MDSTGSRYGLMEAYCKQGNESWISTKYWEFLDHQKNYQLLKKGSAPRHNCFSTKINITTEDSLVDFSTIINDKGGFPGGFLYDY